MRASLKMWCTIDSLSMQWQAFIDSESQRKHYKEQLINRTYSCQLRNTSMYVFDNPCGFDSQFNLGTLQFCITTRSNQWRKFSAMLLQTLISHIRTFMEYV